jgi:hypothetical protein
MSRQQRPIPEEEPEEDEEMDLEEDEDMDGFEALASLLATEDGDTIAMSLQNLANSTDKIALGIEMQNKILVKILTAVSKAPACPCAKSAKEDAETA